MKSRNMHYAFNKEYFDEILCKNTQASECSQYLYDFKYSSDAVKSFDSISSVSNSEFELYTIYPGLLIGSGYPHNSGEKNTIVGGFSFDYISGLPTIPGSTVKGILRSYFAIDDNKSEKQKSIKAEKQNMIKEILGNTSVNIDNLAKDIFDNNDVFLGGYPVLKENELVVGPEYITPHKDPVKDPVPLNMLKVLPGTKYKFLFVLSDYIGNGSNDKPEVTKDDKANLFKELLLFGGIGAKTNIGFGQLSDVKVEKSAHVSTKAAAGMPKQANNKPVNKNSDEAPKCRNKGCNNKVTKNPKGHWNTYCRECFNKGKNNANNNNNKQNR